MSAPKRGGRKRKNDTDDKPEKKKKAPPPQEEPVHLFFPLPPPGIFNQMFSGDGNEKDGIPAKFKALKEKLLKLNIDDKVKERVISRLKNIDTSEKHKHLEWF